MSFEFYKVVHFTGILTMVTALIITSAQAASNESTCETTNRFILRGIHTVAAFLILVGGFGMLARKGVLGGDDGFPGWVQFKLGIWLLLALSMIVARRRPMARWLLIAVPALVVVAGAIALYQPF